MTTKATITATLAALLLTASCSGKPEVLEPDSPVPSVSPDAPKAPALPDKATESSDEGAATFAKHWIDVFNVAAQTGDVRELTDLSRTCRPCQDFATSVAEMDPKDRPSEPVWTVTSTEVIRDRSESRVKFDLRLQGGERSTVAFSLTPRAPYSINDLYRVKK